MEYRGGTQAANRGGYVTNTHGGYQGVYQGGRQSWNRGGHQSTNRGGNRGGRPGEHAYDPKEPPSAADFEHSPKEDPPDAEILDGERILDEDIAMMEGDEPKVFGNQANTICSSFGYEEWVRVEAVGFSGGISVLWKSSISIEVLNTHPQFITLQVHQEGIGLWRLSVVYGSPNLSLRRRLFAELTCLSPDFQGPWLMAGGFNSVTSQEEVSNPESFYMSRCSDFNQWLFREGLIDLGYTGAKFSWMRGTNSSTLRGARLDRALSNVEWKLRFPDTTVIHLPRIESDHSPLLINNQPAQVVHREKAFRFNMAWATQPGFISLVHSNWKRERSLEENKRNMAAVLTTWNTNTFGNVFQRKKRLLVKLGGIQNCIANNSRPELIKLERRLRLELEEVLYQEELIWFQRSREQWITSGDRNTKYYHIATSVKSSYNKISRLKTDNETWITDELEIRNHVRSYFVNLYKKERSSNIYMLQPRKFPRLADSEWEEVNAPFHPDDIKQALFDMAPCKAPGPDGYTAGFYQKSWSIIGDCVVRYVQEFFESGILPPGSNDTLISLIPKVSNPKSVKQLRPIGLLCNLSYKILTKRMTSRLKGIAKKLIGHHQTSFVPGRSVLDNILVYQEVLNSMKYKQGVKGWVVVKLDLEKAYDRLSWSFLEDTLKDIDDLILFGEATMEQPIEVNNCLRAFCAASGQKVSLPKSSVFFSRNTNPDLQQRISETLGMLVVSDMGKYLGVPSHHGRLSKESFSGIIDRIRAKLAGWKSKSLSLAGRYTLVQSVLTSIPYYTMQTTLLPKGVVLAIERITRDFLWGSKEGERKCHLVKWEVLTKSKEFGGLGIRKLEPMNLAFLAKLGWRLIQDEECLWVQLLKAKYSIPSTDCTTWKPKTNMSNAWKGILRAVPILVQGTRKLVRNGNKTAFWRDTWLEDRPLYQLATSLVPWNELDRPVSHYWNANTGWQWEALNQMLPEEVLSRLAARMLHEGQNMDDETGWKDQASGDFSVRTVYNIATGEGVSIEAAKWNMWNMCPAADRVWRAVLPSFSEKTKALSFSRWLEEGITNKGDGRNPVNNTTVFAVTTWWIWRWRNEVTFTNTVKHLQYKLSWIKTQVEEVNRAFAKAKYPGSQGSEPNWQMLSWTKPQEGYVKVNVDGAVDRITSRASCGGAIRNENGAWKQGYTYSIGYCTPFEAEAWALFKGVQLAVHLGCNRVIFESDSNEIVDYMNADRPPSIAAHNILEACRRELRCIECWQIRQIAREQNLVADFLSKLSRGLPGGLKIFTDPPVDILGLLEDDITGFPLWHDVCIS
ncbi:uncharacterized protein LOC116015942 [Ipomoea triloba]|uniref:uncharacterized protein LOC116015942 n=1 Tax=Ipomoea triloba TaxID=35885 RepID=UPI00125D0BC4|nr:uncharacterized protein LOC116015942 [Ipomoea triloba]